ncbi:hypothetical protein JQX13_52295 [Archangium violaceum]|uniref:hypothetical protein n=1 Tax=Archangium violaceum TaxID=83451 RepID=UPI00193B52EA|nr:hypothetical protein [Archangium violaceum]QRK08407.1 hypothetical protein JQX13_52295 [Archangium violaceum]
MKRVLVMAGLLVLMLGTGCPVGGEAGVLRQALLRDEIKRMVRGGCQPAAIRARCAPDDYDACMEVCVQEMEVRDWQ